MQRHVSAAKCVAACRVLFPRVSAGWLLFPTSGSQYIILLGENFFKAAVGNQMCALPCNAVLFTYATTMEKMLALWYCAMSGVECVFSVYPYVQRPTVGLNPPAACERLKP